MKLTVRYSASGFIEIKVDEIEVTISDDSKQEVQDMIDNLTEVVEEMYDRIGKEVYIDVCDK